MSIQPKLSPGREPKGVPGWAQRPPRLLDAAGRLRRNTCNSGTRAPAEHMQLQAREHVVRAEYSIQPPLTTAAALRGAATCLRWQGWPNVDQAKAGNACWQADLSVPADWEAIESQAAQGAQAADGGGEAQRLTG